MLWRLSDKPLIFSKIILLVCFIAVIAILNRFNISCPVYEITAVPCPTCKMGRALCSLAKGELIAYVNYNIMAFPVALAFIGEVFIDSFKKYENIFRIYSVIILSINFIYYLLRLGNCI